MRHLIISEQQRAGSSAPAFGVSLRGCAHPRTNEAVKEVIAGEQANLLSPLEARSSKFDWRRSIDFFRFEHQKFERDVHTVVLKSLEAGVKQLERVFKRTSERFDARLERATPEQEDWIVDDFMDIRADHEDQERFLRKIAIVALLARLTHVLRQFPREGDEIAARSDSGYPGENEFQQLWAEFRLRFGIQIPPNHIQWIEPLRRARNLIVHNGGLANPIKYEANEHGGPKPKRDTSFSKRYRELWKAKLIPLKCGSRKYS